MPIPVTKCRRCGCTRDPLLLGALPCEQCGAAPDQYEDAELPPDDSWSGQPYREERGPPAKSKRCRRCRTMLEPEQAGACPRCADPTPRAP